MILLKFVLSVVMPGGWGDGSIRGRAGEGEGEEGGGRRSGGGEGRGGEGRGKELDSLGLRGGSSKMELVRMRMEGRRRVLVPEVG